MTLLSSCCDAMPSRIHEPQRSRSGVYEGFCGKCHEACDFFEYNLRGKSEGRSCHPGSLSLAIECHDRYVNKNAASKTTEDRDGSGASASSAATETTVGSDCEDTPAGSSPAPLTMIDGLSRATEAAKARVLKETK